MSVLQGTVRTAACYDDLGTCLQQKLLLTASGHENELMKHLHVLTNRESSAEFNMLDQKVILTKNIYIRDHFEEKNKRFDANLAVP